MGGSLPDDGRVAHIDGKVRLTHMRRTYTVYDLAWNGTALKRMPHGHHDARWRAFIAEDGTGQHFPLVGWKVTRDLSGRTLEKQLEAAQPGLPVLVVLPPPPVVDEDTDESWMDWS
jgi:hypothetical protein